MYGSNWPSWVKSFTDKIFLPALRTKLLYYPMQESLKQSHLWFALAAGGFYSSSNNKHMEKQLTPEQRLEYYQQALDFYEGRKTMHEFGEGWQNVKGWGICEVLATLQTEDWSDIDDIESDFPEFAKRKPVILFPDRHHGWWGFNEEGRLARIVVLKECIEELKTVLTN